VAVTNTTSSSLSWFFIVPGATETVTVTETYGSGVTASATEYYSVAGPTGDTPSAAMLPNNQTVQITTTTIEMGDGSIYTGPVLYDFGTPLTCSSDEIPPEAGVVFSTNDCSAPASGSFLWVQIVNGDQTKELDSNGNWTCPAQPESGLDKTYPYSTGPSANDSPPAPLSPEAELQRSFNATMYLLWDPAIPPADQQTCSPAQLEAGSGVATTCASIPIPLGWVSWGFSGCAINTLAQQMNNGTTWTLNCGIAAPSTPQQTGYPSWNNPLNNPTVTCVKQ